MEKISHIQDAATQEVERVRLEREQIAQALFEQQQQQALALEIKSRNLKDDLQKKEVYSIAKRDAILEKGFGAAKREYWACRWLIVLLFTISTWTISANVFEFSAVVTVTLTTFLSAVGYWFVPEFLEPLTKVIADRRFNSFVGHIDADIDCSHVTKNYKSSIWSINP